MGRKPKGQIVKLVLGVTPDVAKAVRDRAAAASTPGSKVSQGDVIQSLLRSAEESASDLEWLPSSTPKPSDTVTGPAFRRATIPCVYGWRRGRSYLYVGMSLRGLARPLGEHHVINSEEPFLDGDFLDVWHASTDEIRALESKLIRLLKPLLNKTMMNDSPKIQFNCRIPEEILTLIVAESERLTAEQSRKVSQADVIEIAIVQWCSLQNGGANSNPDFTHSMGPRRISYAEQRRIDNANHLREEAEKDKLAVAAGRDDIEYDPQT